MEASPFRFKMNILPLKSSAFPKIKCLKIDVLNRPSPTLVNPRELHHVLGEPGAKGTSGAGQVLWIDLHCSHSYDCCAYFSSDLPGRGKLQVQGFEGAAWGLVLVFFFSYVFYQEQW